VGFYPALEKPDVVGNANVKYPLYTGALLSTLKAKRARSAS